MSITKAASMEQMETAEQLAGCSFDISRVQVWDKLKAVNRRVETAQRLAGCSFDISRKQVWDKLKAVNKRVETAQRLAGCSFDISRKQVWDKLKAVNKRVETAQRLAGCSFDISRKQVWDKLKAVNKRVETAQRLAGCSFDISRKQVWDKLKAVNKRVETAQRLAGCSFDISRKQVWDKLKAVCACGWLLLSPCTAPADSAPYTAHGDKRLAALIAEALERNPGIHEALLDSQAARHRIPQATALPDPTLSITWHAEPPQTRTGPQRAGIAVSQRFPWFGKQADRGAAARKLAEASDEAAAMHRAEVVRQVKWAYYGLAYLDRAIALAMREEEVLRLYESMARAHYAQGIGLQQAVVKLQAEITRVLSHRDGLRQWRTETEVTLNGLRDRPDHEHLAEAAIGLLPVAAVDEDRLHHLARAHRPEVRAARLRVASEEDNVRLAQRQYWPDLTLAAAWGAVGQRRDEAGRLAPPPDNGKDTASFTLGVTVPLHRTRYRAAEREAVARLDAAKAAYRRTVNEVDADVRTAGVRLSVIGERIARFEKALLPQTEQAQRSTELAYSAGTIGVLDLLDSEEALLDAQLGLARLKSDYMQALADMERALGTAFPDEPS